MIYDIITKKYKKKIYLLEKRYDKKLYTATSLEKVAQLNEWVEKARDKIISNQIKAYKRVFTLQRIFKKGD